MQVLAKLSSKLYHKTGETQAIKILEENQFRLSTWIGTSSDKPNPDQVAYHWFLSTSYHKMASGASSTDVTLVLDGGKLAQKYAGAPFDYWGKKHRDLALSPDPQRPSKTEERIKERDKFDEAEERVLSDKPTIPNADKYIKEIHAIWFVRYGDSYGSHDYKRKRQLTLLAKQHNIPIFWYEKPHDKELLAKSRAKKFSDFPVGESMTPEQLKSEQKYRGQSAYSVEKWEALLSVYNAKTYEDLPKNIGKFIGGWSDTFEGYAADIHNATKGGMKPGEMRYVAKLSKQMKLMNITSIKEFVQKAQDKVHRLWKESKAKQTFKSEVASKYTFKESL